MAWSKSTRIGIMLAIDIAFFFLELITGFLVGSLALTADAFHMLNDIISLLVGLWAVRVARKETTDKYSYGWVRAEIVGAFFNAVFLIALCVSIILEAITRFFDPPVIDNPKLILIVDCAGLASNLVGFLVLGGHGHSHGAEEEGSGHAHDHDGAHDHIHEAEEGRNEYYSEFDITDEDGRVADVLPEAAVARATMPPTESPRHARLSKRDKTPEPMDRCGSRVSTQSRGRERRRTGSIRHSRLTSIDDLSIHPASFRQEIIAASRPQIEEVSSESDRDSTVCDEPEAIESTPLIQKDDEGTTNGHSPSHSRQNSGSGKDHKHDDHHASPSTPIQTATPQVVVEHEQPQPRRSMSERRRRARTDSQLHKLHNHNKPKCRELRAGTAHGHSHGDMGMNAMVLHVLGDALGNIGVILTALVIWLTDWPGRHYADPAVSLLIAAIILHSALPLTFATSKILLQATPDHIDVSDIKEDIQTLPGVISCHHVHIWQLSDTKIVASLHVQVSFPIGAAGGEKYMELARRARRCLHAYGIHSATIQPEFCLNEDHDHGEDAALMMDGTTDAKPRKKKGLMRRAGAHAHHTQTHGKRGHADDAMELDEEDEDDDAGEESGAAGSVSRSSLTLTQQPREGGVRRRVRFPGACGRTQGNGDFCLLDQCVDDCVGMGCCSTLSSASSTAETAVPSSQGSGHSHPSAHGHGDHGDHRH